MVVYRAGEFKLSDYLPGKRFCRWNCGTGNTLDTFGGGKAARAEQPEGSVGGVVQSPFSPLGKDRACG